MCDVPSSPLSSVSYVIISILAQQNDAAPYNRCIITSRIVGYEKGDFTETHYAHYTLLELEGEQVADFLTAWCPAVERFQAKALYKTGVLSAQQEQQVQQLGHDAEGAPATSLAA